MSPARSSLIRLTARLSRVALRLHNALFSHPPRTLKPLAPPRVVSRFLKSEVIQPLDLFPTELWLEVFSHLPPAARRSLSSTHRMLYDIARQFGFTEFTLYTYPSAFPPQQAQLDDALERLRFWTSPNIAPHVRVCFTREVWYLWQESASSRKDDGEHVLINAFFECLPHFTGLERLYAQDIQFTPTGITNLCGLPALTYLEVSGGTNLIREQVDPALTLRITNMTMRLHHRREDAWFSLLSPDALRELELFNPVALAKSDVAPFPNVHTLKAGHLSGHAVEIFNKFPNLRSFSDTYGDVLRNLTLAQELSIFPVLEEYTGTHQNLHIFVQRATLTHITLAFGLLFADLAAELHGISALPNITFLAVRFITSESDQDAFGEAETEALFSFFPNLTELQLTLIPTEHGELLARRMTSFLQMLPSRFFLPSTLHSISLKWDFSQCDKSDLGMWHNLESPSDISDFATLRAGLVAKCPALAYILLDRYHFLFLWSKTSSVWEATAYTYRDAEIIRRQLRRNI